MDVVVVSPLTADGILGLDFLQTQRASIDLDKEQVHLAECNCTISLHRPSLQPGNTRVKVRAEKTLEVPAYSEIEIMACLERPILGGMWLLENVVRKHTSTVVARALVQPTPTHVPVRLLNPMPESVTIYAGKEIATFESVEYSTNPVNHITEGTRTDQEAEQSDILWKLVEESGAQLDEVRKKHFSVC